MNFNLDSTESEGPGSVIELGNSEEIAVALGSDILKTASRAAVAENGSAPLTIPALPANISPATATTVGLDRYNGTAQFEVTSLMKNFRIFGILGLRQARSRLSGETLNLMKTVEVTLASWKFMSPRPNRLDERFCSLAFRRV